jgi:DnaK suppressor protein
MKKKIDLPEGYKPTPEEEYMNTNQLEYFRQKLLNWREEVMIETSSTFEYLQSGFGNEADISDQAANAVNTELELRTRDRARKLVDKIDAALERIEKGTYGYCEETEEPIGLKRLEARPIATLCIEAQERHEKFERTHSED